LTLLILICIYLEMTGIEVFFISALIWTTKVPDSGWLQWTQDYATKEACESVIRKDYILIHNAIKNHIGKDLKQIRELRCLTFKEAVRFNSRLGH
jgi:hypothetical protein